jgi:pilus assembly protein FimV
MGRIAASVKPDGVSLEQALIGIFRSNPQAFINKNVNLVRSGKILRVPEKEQLMAIPQADAARELRVQIGNWNTYRQKLADTASPAPESKPVTSGKITARVEDKSSTDSAKDVVRLSKGDASDSAADGKDGKPAGADKVRALEEELVARDKALAEANDRVKQLEKTLQDMQKLVDLKGGDPALVASPKPDAKDETLKDVAKAEPPKMEPLKSADKVAAAAVDNAPVMAPKSTAEAPKIAKAPAKPTPKAKAKASPPPPPKPEPGMLDMVSDNIVPIGGGAVLVGLGAFWALRRRKKSDTAEDDESTSIAPEIKSEPIVAEPINDAGAASSATVAAAAVAPIASVAVSSEAVDPMEEAQVYLDHGRDVQAEDILKEAMQKDPQREDFQLKLLEIYATRNDKTSFGSLATGFNALTGGHGDNWTRVAAMGYALDPDNALYDVGRDVVVDIAAGAGSTDVPNLDFDIGGDSDSAANLGSTADIELDAGTDESDLDKTQVVNRGDVMSAHSAHDPDTVGDSDLNEPITMFNLEVPTSESAGATAPAADASPVADAGGALDFNLELPSLDSPEVPAETAPAPKAAPAADTNMDFKVDFSELDLKIDDNEAAAPAGDVKDAHWDDVQQKFDLARAYQEMGDKEGAKEILQEVMREGSDQQKADAEKMIAALA